MNEWGLATFQDSIRFLLLIDFISFRSFNLQYFIIYFIYRAVFAVNDNVEMLQKKERTTDKLVYFLTYTTVQYIHTS